jgi:hypothetical protein
MSKRFETETYSFNWKKQSANWDEIDNFDYIYFYYSYHVLTSIIIHLTLINNA